MPTTSITAAAVTKYEALTAANFPSATRPRIDFGGVVQVATGTTQIRPPYVRLTDAGRQVKPIDFERNAFVTVDFVFEVWAASLADVDTIVTAIRLNGGTVGQGLGFDYGTLSDLSSPKSTHQIVPTSEPRYLDPATDRDGNRIHGSRLQYRVTVLESA